MVTVLVAPDPGSSVFLAKPREQHMSLFVIVAIIAVVLLVVGGFVQALQFLLWVGAVLLIIAIIGWVVRAVSGSNR
jgi:phosphate starvation-inducible membrane PsiE